MKTTIGIPVYDDLAGLQWTLQDLLIHHDLSDIEIIIVDNNPKTNKRTTSNTIQYVRGIGGKYIPLIKPVGTAPARNKIFEKATGDIIIVCDSHIIFAPKTIQIIQNYLKNNPKDIVTGPLLKRSLRPDGKRLMVHATHYSDIWRKEMWGVWAQAWLCSCKQYHFEVRPELNNETPKIEIINGNIISAQYYPKPPKSAYYEIKLDGSEITKCPNCDKQILKTKHHQHIKNLIENGYIPRGWSDIDTEPFEIPGLGLGMFACRKEAWPGFPQEMQGFGGGEMHLHEQFRRNGGKAICLPNAKWWHYFEYRKESPPYKPQLWDKVRNYIIWRNHLNMPLDPIYNHFVTEANRLTDQQWDYISEDPIPRKNKPDNLPDPQPIKKQITGSTLEQLYDSALRIDKNFEYYFPIIKKLATDKIVSITRRNHWDIAILSGKPTYYISNSLIVNDIQEKLLNIRSRDIMYEYYERGEVEPFQCDMLLVDIFGSREYLDKVFEQWCNHVTKRFIIIGTGIFGDMPEDRMIKNGGLYHSMIDFTNDGKWKRVYHSKYGLGLTVISNNPLEKSIDMGVGYNLTKLYSSLKIFPKEDCECKRRNRLMNEIGPEGCLERFDELVADMKKDADKYGWNDKITAGTNAILNGLAFKINPFKPIESMLTIAIKQAQQP